MSLSMLYTLTAVLTKIVINKGWDMYSEQSWNDFFDSQIPKIDYISKTKALYSDQVINNYYVSNSFFEGLESDKFGGAIRITKEENETKHVIEKSIFRKCKSVTGGAIFLGYEVESIVSQVCAYQCSASNQTSFLFSQSLFPTVYKNWIIDSSVCHCNAVDYFTINLKDGLPKFSTLNSSCNEASTRTGFGVVGIDYGTTVASYCSFKNNTSTQYICLYFTYAKPYEISNCNIIENKQAQKDGYGLITSDGQITIKDSYIMNNEGSIIVFVNSQDEKITANIENCILDFRMKASGSVNFGKTPEVIFVNLIKFFETDNCHSEVEKGYIEKIYHPVAPCKLERKRSLRYVSGSMINILLYLNYE